MYDVYANLVHAFCVRPIVLAWRRPCPHALAVCICPFRTALLRRTAS